MNGLTAALIVFPILLLVGVLVFVIVHHTYQIWEGQSSIVTLNSNFDGLRSNLVTSGNSNAGRLLLLGQALSSTQMQSDLDKLVSDQNTSDVKAATAALTAMHTDVQSNRFSFLTPTSATAGDSLSLSNTAPKTSNQATEASPSSWLHLTDKNSSNYANMAVNSMWADKGIAVTKGSCVDFGNGMSMCGDTSSPFLAGSAYPTAAAAAGGTIAQGLQLTIKGATSADPKNKSSLNTSLPGDTASSGMNRIVGDTMLTADMQLGGNVSVGGNGSVGAGIVSSAVGSHYYSKFQPSTTVTAGNPIGTMSFGFATPGLAAVPTSGTDVIRLSKTSDQGSHVRILGSLEVCDEAGNNCFPVQLEPNALTPRTPAVANTVQWNAY